MSTPAPSDLRLQIFDATGRLISEETWPTETELLEIQTVDWPSGIFTMKILDENGTLQQVLRGVKTE